MGSEDQKGVANIFCQSLASRDWVSFKALLSDQADWRLPGVSKVSGHIEGADAIVRHLQMILEYDVHVTLKQTLFSHENIAFIFHNTAESGGRRLDVHLATVCRLSNGKIRSMETYNSDVDQVNHYFI